MRMRGEIPPEVRAHTDGVIWLNVTGSPNAS